jgi:hypothetical protein
MSSRDPRGNPEKQDRLEGSSLEPSIETKQLVKTLGRRFIHSVFGPRMDPSHPLEARGARRVLLLIPALFQFLVAWTFMELSLESHLARLVAYSVALLIITGGVGLLSRRRRLFWLGLLGAMLGFLLPLIMGALSTPVDKDHSYLPGIGTYDAEGVGIILALRLIFEIPFWLLYGAVVLIFWARTLWVRRQRMTTANPQ